MTIYLASDHAGFELKNRLKTLLKELGYAVRDEGAFAFVSDDDYPDFVKIAAKQVSSDPLSRGIVIGGSGQGEAIVANREKSVRAVVYYGGPLEVITLSRIHNDANVLSLGARFLTAEEAIEAVKLWLGTDFPAEERHIRRIRKIDESEEGKIASF
jgi:ribose 5-phosphate isomerase B